MFDSVAARLDHLVTKGFAKSLAGVYDVLFCAV